ncbi:hypothetical protein PVK06_026554 [Gossypium arboreum]|uniref:Uncharacterized protein n=1 Tax=Gossypium arboreum TaxID=29729 RepID=A0ABR0NY06_GOSAR|nr:hypothetical protein PVK06_026554 [Gossypium arboreum]
MDYIWSGDELDYNADIYEEAVYEDRDIQENQRLLMLELSQLQGETPVLSQDDNDHIGIPLEKYQEEFAEQNKVTLAVPVDEPKMAILCIALALNKAP